MRTASYGVLLRFATTLEKMLGEHGFEPTGFAGAGRWPLMWKSMLIKARVIQ
jgi:hypothetical protein